LFAFEWPVQIEVEFFLQVTPQKFPLNLCFAVGKHSVHSVYEQVSIMLLNVLEEYKRVPASVP